MFTPTVHAVMEEADQILLISLRQVLGPEHLEGCESAADVSCGLLVRACSRCLAAIAPEAPVLPEALPPDMSGRFKLGTELAGRIQGLGFRGSIGFHQLLYPSEADARAVLVFLLDLLPKGAQGPADGGGGLAGGTTTAAVRGALAAFCASSKGAASLRAPPAEVPFWTVALAVNDASLLTSQAWPPARLCPSIIQYLGDQAASATAAERAQMAQLRRAEGSRPEALRASLEARFGAAFSAGIGAGFAKHISSPPANLIAAPEQPSIGLSAGTGAGDAAPVETAQSRLQQREEQLAQLQAQLQTLGERVAAAEAQTTAWEEQAQASRKRAQEAAAGSAELEAQYMWRKQAAQVLMVRPRPTGNAITTDLAQKLNESNLVIQLYNAIPRRGMPPDEFYLWPGPGLGQGCGWRGRACRHSCWCTGTHGRAPGAMGGCQAAI